LRDITEHPNLVPGWIDLSIRKEIAMYKAVVRWMIRRNVKALAAGDPGPLLAGYADDAVLVFPGRSTWSGEYRGKPAIEGFLRRYLADGLVGQSHDILVNGPPWRMTIAVLFTVQAKAPTASWSTTTEPSCSSGHAGARSSTKRTLRTPTSPKSSRPTLPAAPDPPTKP
jgi:hypothetical protein